MGNIEKVLGALKAANIDLDFIIKESFLGFRERKLRGILYNSDLDLPKKLITLYFICNPRNIELDTMKKSFVSKYRINESKIESVGSHSMTERKGLELMYDYIHSEDINYRFDVYTLKDLHSKLFSLCPHPEYAGDFRNIDVFLPGTGTELASWTEIRPRLNEADKDVQAVLEMSEEVRKHNSSALLFKYIDECVNINCKLIKIHPFVDGNGRTVRGFLNKLFEYGGLPPVYINDREKTEYHKAMNRANNDGDYSDIQNFYLYKICDSIVELDIKERIKTEQSVRNKRKHKNL